jgi:hypothetical protein
MCSTTLAVFLLGGTTIAAEYEITVDMDETTSGDFEMVETFLDAANDDSVPSKSLRRVLMGGTGELASAADARFDASGNLMLDDGSLVQFLDEDVLKVRRKLCSKRLGDGQCGNATIAFHCLMKPNNVHRKCQPFSVQVCPAAGGTITAFVPPARTKGGVEVCPPGGTGGKLCRLCIHK